MFYPPGIAARNLAECLSIQLRQLVSTPGLAAARLMVDEQMNLLVAHDYKKLIRVCSISEEDLVETLDLIQSLNPRPGNMVSHNSTEYIMPDVLVRREKQRWIVTLNDQATPNLRINSGYAAMVRRADNSSDNIFLRNHLQEARWFLKSLQNRNETLLKVATCIVESQRDFFEYGEEAMQPMVLNDIAQAVDLHESTISRITTRKYLHTPRGIFELKFFFSSHVATSDGGECSATAIRALLKKLIAAEDVSKPLSDNKLAQMLAVQGINITRRTVTKYRDILRIPSSHERKRFV